LSPNNVKRPPSVPGATLSLNSVHAAYQIHQLYDLAKP
jgi:hypothetical protein